MSDGSWLLYPWFEEHGASLVHAEDLAAFRKLSPYGKVFQWVEAEGDWTTTAYGEQRFRVRPSLAMPVAAPSFRVGQTVLVRRHQRAARIVEVQWHYLRERPFFLVEAAGRRVKTRYWAEDLEAPVGP